MSAHCEQCGRMTDYLFKGEVVTKATRYSRGRRPKPIGVVDVHRDAWSAYHADRRVTWRFKNCWKGILMEKEDKLEEFRRVSRFMRDTLEEVDALLTPQFTHEVCGHCLEVHVCAPANGIPATWRIALCERDTAVNGWLVIE